MKTRGKMLALVLAGAVLLASGAYAAGTQVDGGSASAAKDDQSRDRPERGFSFRMGPPPGAGDIAEKLGVSEAQLEKALEELRDELAPKGKPGKPRFRHSGPGLAFGPGGNLAKELADELGVQESRVEQALENIRKKHVAEAEAKRDEFLRKLADKLGISVDKVKDALGDGPFMFGGPPGPPRHP